MALAFGVAGSAAGEPGAPAPGSPAALALARKHFDAALADYRDGAYREAIGELDQAITLDPHGKDLVYNRALVYEKLGDMDRAIAGYRRYVEMETNRSDVAHAQAIIRRLEGARREVHKAERDSAPDRHSSPGRLDGWVVGAGAVAVAAAALGTFFGVRALVTQPSADAGTGGGTSYADVQAEQERAHGFAVVADVSFVVALASGATAGALYFLRSPPPAPQAAAGSRGGAALSFGVRF